MPKTNPISWKDMIKILRYIWFEIIRTSWSHHFMQHDDGRITVIPMHNNEDIWIWLIKKILRDIKISDLEFEKIRSKK